MVRFWRAFPGVGGPGNVSIPTFTIGDPVGIDVDGLLLLPIDYVSGKPLADKADFTGATLTSLGLNPGSYTAEFGTGADTDYYTVVVSGLPIPIPEPASFALLGLGAAGVAAKPRRRAKSPTLVHHGHQPRCLL